MTTPGKFKAPRCVVCGDTGLITGSRPELPVSAPLQQLPCPKCINWPETNDRK